MESSGENPGKLQRENLGKLQRDRSKYYSGEIGIRDIRGDVLRSIIHDRNIVRDYLKDNNFRAKQESLTLIKDRIDTFTSNTSKFEEKVKKCNKKLYNIRKKSTEFDLTTTRVNAELGGFYGEMWNEWHGWNEQRDERNEQRDERNEQIQNWNEKIQNWSTKIRIWYYQRETWKNWAEGWEKKFTEISRSNSSWMRLLAVLKTAETHFKTFEEDLPKQELQVSSEESSLNSAVSELENMMQEFSHMKQELTDMQRDLAGLELW